MSAARRILITAGPTREPIDAVRFISNRSSGRLGLALAGAAREAGWAVTLLLGPIEAAVPGSSSDGAFEVARFETTGELRDLLDRHGPSADVVVLAAAVSDYRLADATDGKLARGDGPLTLELEPTPDLARRCAERKRAGQMLIGFALEEPEKLRDRAREKLRRKGLDAIVANPLKTMGDAGIEGAVLTPDGEWDEPGAMPKAAFAEWLMAWIAGKFEDRGAKPE